MSVGTLWCGTYRCAALGSQDLETPVLIWRGGSWYMRSRVPRCANMRGLSPHDLGRALLGGSRIVRVEVASGEGFGTSPRHDSDQVKSLVAGPGRALHSFLPSDRLLHAVDEPASHPPSSRPLPPAPIHQPPLIFPAAIGLRVYPQYHPHLRPESRRPIPRPGPSDFLRGVDPMGAQSLVVLVSTSLVPHTLALSVQSHRARSRTTGTGSVPATWMRARILRPMPSAERLASGPWRIHCAEDPQACRGCGVLRRTPQATPLHCVFAELVASPVLHCSSLRCRPLCIFACEAVLISLGPQSRRARGARSFRSQLPVSGRHLWSSKKDG